VPHATLKEYRWAKIKSPSIIHALEKSGREKGCKKASPV